MVFYHRGAVSILPDHFLHRLSGMGGTDLFFAAGIRKLVLVSRAARFSFCSGVVFHQ